MTLSKKEEEEYCPLSCPVVCVYDNAPLLLQDKMSGGIS